MHVEPYATERIRLEDRVGPLNYLSRSFSFLSPPTPVLLPQHQPHPLFIVQDISQQPESGPGSCGNCGVAVGLSLRLCRWQHHSKAVGATAGQRKKKNSSRNTYSVSLHECTHTCKKKPQPTLQLSTTSGWAEDQHLLHHLGRLFAWIFKDSLHNVLNVFRI